MSMRSPCWLLPISWAALLAGSPARALAPPRPNAPHRGRTRLASLPARDRRADAPDPAPARPPSNPPTRRAALRRAAAVAAAPLAPFAPRPASALPPLAIFSDPFDNRANTSNGGTYVPARRCTAYQVDGTIPPTLLPYRAGREAAILKGLGQGGGTSKSPMIEDDVNLNNIMNKAVFGAIDAVKGAAGVGDGGPERAGEHYQSFVFLGADFDDTFTAAPEQVGGATNADASLAVQLLTDICRPKERRGNTAIGLAFAPQSGRGALDAYLAAGGDEEEAERAAVAALAATGASEDLARRHLPLLRFAKRQRCALLPLAPEPADLAVVRRGGLQALDAARRDAYVADAPGFIALTQEPRFRLYTDKSLLKDFAPSAPSADEAAVKAESAAFFAERILVHEAGATAVARWASSRPDALVATVAPIRDVRFLGGINGRIPRVCRAFDPDTLVDDEAVTTILLNPSARETLSESRWLRLEIGTAPNNWEYQTKVADYLWFSSMPKVNMIPRMMNEQ